MHKTSKGIKPRFIQSFINAFNGIFTALKQEKHLKFHFFAMGVVIIAGLFFKITLYEWIVLSIVIGLVISFELINTAIEEICDFIHPDKHLMIGKIKDIAAGSVLVFSIVAVIVGLLIFIKYIV